MQLMDLKMEMKNVLIFYAVLCFVVWNDIFLVKKGNKTELILTCAVNTCVALPSVFLILCTTRHICCIFCLIFCFFWCSKFSCEKGKKKKKGTPQQRGLSFLMREATMQDSSCRNKYPGWAKSPHCTDKLLMNLLPF